nr:MAG TPA: hypothetical protein [Caudoviricetes sp.]
MSKWTKKQKKVMKKISEASVATETDSRYKFKFISALYEMSKLGVNIKQASKDRYQTEGCYYPLLSIYTTNALQDSIIELLQTMHGEGNMDMEEFKSKYAVYRNVEGNYWDIAGETCRLTHVHDSLLWRVRYDYDHPMTMCLNYEDENTFNCVEIDISGDLIHDEDAYYDFCEYFNKHATWLYTAISPAYWSFDEISIEHRDSTNRDEEFADFLADIFGTYPSWTPEEYKKSKYARRRKKNGDWFEHYAGDKFRSSSPKLKVVMQMSSEKRKEFATDFVNAFNNTELAHNRTKPLFKFVNHYDKKYGNHIQLIATEMMNMTWVDIKSYAFDLEDAAYRAINGVKQTHGVDYALVTNVTAPAHGYISQLYEMGDVTKEELEEFGGCWTSTAITSDTVSVYTPNGMDADKSVNKSAGYIPVIDIYFGTFDELSTIKLPPVDYDRYEIDTVDIAVCNALNKFAKHVYWVPMFNNIARDNKTSYRIYFPAKPLSATSGNIKTTPDDLKNEIVATDELVEMMKKIIKDPDNGYIKDIEQVGITVKDITAFIPYYINVSGIVDDGLLDSRAVSMYDGIWTDDTLTDKSRSYISKNMKRCYKPLNKTAGFLPFVSVTWEHKD